MGDPKKTKKHFERPLKIWNKASIEKEKDLRNTYGFKNKRELWKAETILKKKRKSARQLLAMPLEKRIRKERELLDSLIKMGLLGEKAGLDDVLTLSVETLLERRLQTVVWRKGLANSIKQARQFIVHGHIAIAGKRVTSPGYSVPTESEKKIGYYAGRKLELQPKLPPKKHGKGAPATAAAQASGDAAAAEAPVEGLEEAADEAEETAGEKGGAE